MQAFDTGYTIIPFEKVSFVESAEAYFEVNVANRRFRMDDRVQLEKYKFWLGERYDQQRRLDLREPRVDMGGVEL